MAEALNKQLFNEAKKYIPGGVNSPVRAFKAVGGSPVFIKGARGSKVYSECGREFIDYCLSWGALILGHNRPEVAEVLKQAIKNSTSFGAATKQETELAHRISEAIPSIERVRLTNSGTEAVMGAVRLARAFTEKNKIIKFTGAYHGHADYLLDSPRGVPGDFIQHTLVADYNDIEKVKALVGRYARDLAAIIVEPVAANMGVVLPKKGFLQDLREITQRKNIVLIFDEVITGFRLAYGGAQELFGIDADLTCLGKIIGGGLPVGAFGGRKEIMQLLAPEGDVYQAGTFSGNPLTVSAGLSTLKILSEANPYLELKKKTRYLCENIKQKAETLGVGVKVNFIGSVFTIFFADGEVWDYNTAKRQDAQKFKRFYHSLLKEGVYLSPSPFEANFISLAHTGQDLEKTLKAVDKAFKVLPLTPKVSRVQFTDASL